MRSPSKKSSSARNSNPRLNYLAAALLVFLFLTSVALVQSDGDPALQFRPWSDTKRWLRPIRLNPGADRLAVEGTINSITSVPETGRVWAVGNGGLILYSTDWGWTWTQQNPPDAPAAPTAGSKRAWLSLPAVQAFEKPPEKKSDVEQTNKAAPVQQYPNQAEQNAYLPPDAEAKLVKPQKKTLQSRGPQQKPLSEGALTGGQPRNAAQAEFTDDLIEIRMSDSHHGSAIGRYNSELVTSDGGRTWQFKNRTRSKRLQMPNDPGYRSRFRVPTRALLYALHFEPGLKQGWLAGEKGVILHTEDGGANWEPQTRLPEEQTLTCTRLPALWYYLLTFPLVGLLVWRASKPLPPREERQMVEGVLTSDAPLDAKAPDTMDFGRMARGLSRFIRHEKTTPPLTIAIDGEWGSGKSSLMNLLRADLERFDFRPVWFNAWHHQGEEHLLAALLESIRTEATPPWWRPDNWIFRFRLLRIRGVRNWLPVLLLLCVLSGLTATILLRGGDQIAIASLAEHVRNLDFAKAVEYLPKSTPTLAFLATALSMLAAFWRGLTAFGVSPAKMLASVSSNARMRDLKVQTGFRQKFAQEFCDVTEALGSRSLIIFIDDIDRCSPENVLTVLEAVNFLASSGGCFIVIGMARSMVERAVGLQFAAVAEEMADDGLERPTREQRRERRLRFARQYLDKLINIEIPLPEPTDEQARRLLLERKSVEPEQAPATIALGWIQATTRQCAPLLLAAASVLAGVWMGSYLAPGPTTTSPSSVNSRAPTENVPITALQQSIGEDLRNVPKSPIPKLVKPPDPSDGAKWLMVIGGVLLAGFAVWKLREPPGLVVYDSREFQEAVDAWCDVVRTRQNTPRSLKRFMNRVRYLAMHQMPPEPRDSWMSELIQRVAQKLGYSPSKALEDQPFHAMRESMLVALSALHYLNPSLIARTRELKAADDDVIGRAIAEHIRDSFPWPPSQEDLNRFYSVLPSIRLNDTRSKATGAV